MRSLHLAAALARASTQQELAYRSNFFISVLHSLLNLATGLLGLVILFDQVALVRGWDFASSLTLLGVYLTLAALRDLFIGPSLDALAGMDGAIWRGTFDFSLLRPVNQQFLVSVQRWRPLVLFDLLLGLAVLGSGAMRLGAAVTWGHVTGFILALGAGVVILYSLLLGLTSLVFWGPGFMYTWLFDSLYQMARFPVGLYPSWLRFTLTWIIPVAFMTTLPVEALRGNITAGMLAAGTGVAIVVFAGASLLFSQALQRYASASS